MPEEQLGEEEEEDEEMDEEYTPEMAQELMRRGFMLSKHKPHWQPICHRESQQSQAATCSIAEASQPHWQTEHLLSI